MRRFLLILAFLTLTATGAFAHGGIYRGPGLEIPPGPGPAGPWPNDRKRFQDHLNPPRSWIYWWHHNRVAILERCASSMRVRPNPELVNGTIVPALRGVIAGRDTHADIRGAAFIALARAAPTPLTRKLLTVFARDREDHRLVRESAIVGLAVLGAGPGTATRDLLIEISDDGNAPERERCIAMIALGLLGDESAPAFRSLMRAVTYAPPGRKHCAILALGLSGAPDHVPHLLELYRSSDDQAVRIAALDALGRSGAPDALPVMIDACRRESPGGRRVAAIGLGRLLPDAEESRRFREARRLAERLRTEEDPGARFFTLATLARVGGHPDAGPRVRTACAAALVQVLGEGDPEAERPAAALMLGILLHEGGEPALRQRVLKLLRTRLAEGAGPGETAALALSLGLLKDDSAGTRERLTAVVADAEEERHTRGAAALGLALIGSPDDTAGMIATLTARRHRVLRLETAIAAALSAGPDAVPGLMRHWRDPKMNQFALGATARALSWFPSKATVDAMVAVLEPGEPNGEYPDLTRALVVTSLGLMARTREEPLLERIATDYNFMTRVPAIEELLSIL